MECRAKPYDGTEARTVMIHASTDDAVVFPLIERLNKSGLRVWHDAEIRKVMVDYPRNWKIQQAECSAFLVFLSENAVNMHVFRERLTNAIESGKPLVILASMDRNRLSCGMKLQVEKAERIIQSSYIPQESLTDEIIRLGLLKGCIGQPVPETVVSAYPDDELKPKGPASADKVRNIIPSEQTMLELHGKHEVFETVQPEKAGEALQEPVQEEDPAEMTDRAEAPAGMNETSDLLDETIPLSATNLPVLQNPDDTVVPQRIELPIIISLESGEKKRGIFGESVVGRTKKMQGTMADISFTDDCRLFSGKHFVLVYIDNICMLICKHPNGMNVNGQDMQDGDRYTVDSEALIQIPSNSTLSQLGKNEVHPSYLVVATGEKAKELWNADTVALLQSKQTGETRCFAERFNFGRDNAWKEGVMTSKTISRNHGDIILESGRFLFTDHSTNGTQINGQKINNESMELKNGDIVSVPGDGQNEESFILRYCFFRKG